MEGKKKGREKIRDEGWRAVWGERVRKEERKWKAGWRTVCNKRSE